MLFEDAVKSYLSYLDIIDRSKETIRSYSIELYLMNRFFESCYNGPVYLEDLSADDFKEYLAYEKQRGLSASSRRRMVYIVRSLYKYLVVNEAAIKNVGLQLEVIQIQTREREYLDENEYNILVNSINNPLIRLIVQFLFYTGLRIKECLTLKVDDVNLEKGFVKVRNTKSRHDRRIPLHKEIMAALSEYMDQWRNCNRSPYLFGTAKTGRVSANYVNFVLNAAIKSLGWDRKITCHNLRHSFASNLVKRKVDLVKIQKLMGHSSLKVTGIYTHVDDNELIEAINTL